MIRVTTLVTATMVLRAEGHVWRYTWEHPDDCGHDEHESSAYTYLRDILGATHDQGRAVLAAARADFNAQHEEQR